MANEAFRYARERKVMWPVTVNVPIDGGQVKEVKFSLLLQLLKDPELKALKASAYIEGDETLNIVLDHIHGWKDVLDDDAGGQPMAYTREIMTGMLQDAYIARGVVMALLQASAGAPVKN